MSDKACGDCKFYYENDDTPECRRYAPKPSVGVTYDEAGTQWPSVDAVVDWCWEFEPKQEGT